MNAGSHDSHLIVKMTTVPRRYFLSGTSCQLARLISENKSTASSVSIDDKIAAIQHKPVMSLAGNNTLA